MSTVKQLVDALGPDWSPVQGYTPKEDTKWVDNPLKADPQQPPQIEQGNGQFYVVVQDKQGHQRNLYFKPSQERGVYSGLGPSDLVPTARITGQKNPPAGSRYVDDLDSLQWDQASVLQDVPGSSTKEPTATGQLDKLDAQGNVIKPGDTTTKATQMRDPATGTTFNLVTDPAGTIHDIGNEVWLVKPDGSHTVVGSKPKDASQYNVPGVGLVDYDPTKPDGSRTTVLMATPKDPTKEVFQTINGETYHWNTDTGAFEKTNLPAQQQDIGYTYNDPNSKWIVFYDKQGNVIRRDEKSDFQPKPSFSAGQGPAADLVSNTIPTINPQTGALEFVDNANQVKASEATSQLAQQLGLKVAAGSMSEKAAQDLITNAVNTMNAQSQQQQNQVTAAGDILSNTRGNAQTGAGMLQQRAQSAQGMLGSVLGIAQGGTASGNLGGGMMAAPAGVGGQLVSGISDWTSQLMGGQATMDSAARLLQMADPQSSLADPSSQQAISTLAQLMDKYHQATGVPHPAVAATQAMQQSGQNGGMAAPATAPNPAYASSGAGAGTAGYAGSGGNPWGNAPNGFPAPTTVQSPYSSSGLGPLGAGFAAPSTASPTIVIHMPGAA